jgi:hypothetical protein
MRIDGRIRRNESLVWAIGTALAVAGLLCVPALWTATSGRAQAQGDAIGFGNGAAATTVVIGDATALPGANAAVTVSFTSEELAAAVQIDILYNEDEALIDDPSAACALADRLGTQSLSATFPSTQPDPPMRRLRLGVFPPLVNPNPTFASGELVTCAFTVGAEVALGTEIPLAAERTQVARDEVVICGVGADFPCEEVDGVIRVGEEATPTPTETPTVMETPTEPTVEPTTPAPVPCMSDADCPDGSKCEIAEGDTGVCVPDDCQSDMDCDLNETCDDGICRDIPCSDGCPLGTVCDVETDTCQQVPCTGNEQCPDNTTCENGFCTPPCRFDGDCPDGVCVDNICVECRDDEDCNFNETCVDNTCQAITTDSLVVSGGSGLAGGTAILMVALQGDGAGEVANTLSIESSGLAIAACTASFEIPASFEISSNGGSSVAAQLGGSGSSIAAGALYACDVSIAAGTMPGSKPVTCTGATADDRSIACNDTAIVVESPPPTSTPTSTPTETATPTFTFTPTDTATNTPRPSGGEEDDGCAVVAPAQSGSGSALLLLLAPAFLLWGRRREW